MALLALGQGVSAQATAMPQADARKQGEIVYRSLMRAMGVYLESVRAGLEAPLCEAHTSPEGLLRLLKDRQKIPMSAVAFYSAAGELQVVEPSSLRERLPWLTADWFTEAGGQKWLKGRGVAAHWVLDAKDHSPSMVIRMPLQCEKEDRFETHWWVVFSVPLRLLLDHVKPPDLLKRGESLTIADGAGREVYFCDHGGIPDLRLASCLKRGGPNANRIWTRLQEETAGEVTILGFDPVSFSFRDITAEWQSVSLSSEKGLLIFERISGFSPPLEREQGGLWVEAGGPRMAMLLDGSYVELYLRNENPSFTLYGFGRVLGMSVSAKDPTRSITLEGKFFGEDALDIQVYRPSKMGGVQRETYELRKAKVSGVPTRMRF